MKITLRKEPQLPYAIPVDEVTSPKKKKWSRIYIPIARPMEPAEPTFKDVRHTKIYKH